MDFAEIVKTRRAANFFDPNKPVPKKTIRELVEMAAQSPSSYNLQPWSLMILEDPDDKARLRKLAFDQPKITDAPVVFMVLGDRNAWKEGDKSFEMNFAEMVKSGMPEANKTGLAKTMVSLYGASQDHMQAFAVKNAGFFGMSLMYAAKSLGLESHPMDGFDHNGVKKEFNIPDNYWIPLIMSIGYFDESKEYPAPKWRKSFEDIVVSF
ncbi:nitroreductase [Desulfatibacillum aliphaticivorans]|uniref:Nitroreductase n=1 Tax=Desulfatibacillum aliphaticivorans TaxID=218208 RepID=B8FLV6_DESAL|nr:nitroreductase family protein [Desulfatibacillum aliphaticivorans]ACL05460.1 nitroreductase [Desulfatibacillum aliphaticivorans]